MEKLIISLVTWNSANTIRNCIESVLKQSYKEFSLLIVDNASQDRTCEIIEQFNDPRIRLNRRHENTGFCSGHNFSIANSSSEFVLLLNPDIIMDDHYVENAMQAITADPKIGTVCGLLLQSDVSNPECVIDSAGLEKKRSGVMRLRHHGKKIKQVPLQNERVFGADGALPLYKRAMIKDISYEGEFFDEMFFAHKEDWDVSWRAYTNGWHTVFEPLCIAIHPRHFKPKSIAVRSQISTDIKVHAVKNQLILLLKNEDFYSFLLNFFFIVSKQLAIFLYILFFERSSLKAYRIVFRNLTLIRAKRRFAQSNRGK